MLDLDCILGFSLVKTDVSTLFGFVFRIPSTKMISLKKSKSPLLFNNNNMFDIYDHNINLTNTNTVRQRPPFGV